MELLLLLGVAALALAAVGQRLNVIAPIMLILGGSLFSALHLLPPISFDPKLTLAIFLPPVLYQAALLISWPELKHNLRPILLLAVGLVVFTTLTVGAVAAWLIPGMTLAAGMVLGAIVSPPDAVAATAILKTMKVPRRLVTILEGESLINDATALVLYSMAVAAVVSGSFALGDGVIDFFRIALGGIAVGWVLGRLAVWVNFRLHDPLHECLLSLLLPFICFIGAEHLHLSGVLAVVAAGLVRGAYAPRMLRAQSRLMVLGMWNIIVFVLNAVGFVLIGLQLPAVLSNLSAYSTADLLLYACVISAVVIAVRFLWVFPATYLPRWASPALAARDPAPPAGQVVLVSWAGMRGIVSLVAALALPTATDAYLAFPARDMIIFLAYVIIMVTLVGQGGSFAWLAKKLKVEAEASHGSIDSHIRRQLKEAALEKLREATATGTYTDTAIDRVGQDYEQRLMRLKAAESDTSVEGLIAQDEAHVRALTLLAIAAEREALLRLRKSGAVGNERAQELEQALDLAEIAIGRRG